MNLFSNPLMLILLAVAAVIPIFNGKTILQIILDLVIPKPPAASQQAWEHYTALARQALQAGDTEAAEDYSLRAATEAARFRDAEMEFQPGTIIQWLLKLVTGGAGGGLMPLLLIGGVLFLVASGGCPKQFAPPEATAQPTEAAAVQIDRHNASLRTVTDAPPAESRIRLAGLTIPSVWSTPPLEPATPAAARPSPLIPAPLQSVLVDRPTPDLATLEPAVPAATLVSCTARSCPINLAATPVPAARYRIVQRTGPIRRLLAWRPFANWRPFNGAFRRR